jgi:hypothetical protein
MFAVGAISSIPWAVFAQSGPTATPHFSSVASNNGISFHHRSSRTSQKYLIETMGAGVAWLDYNNDGLLDLFFLNGARLTDPMSTAGQPDKRDSMFWNRLYRNAGDGTFSDATEAAGIQGKVYAMGAAAADYDNDGHTDLYVTGFGRNELYRNRGDGTFEEVAARAGVQAAGWSTGAAFFDFDSDGDLDLVVARYLADWGFADNPWCGQREEGKRGYCHPNAFRSVTHLLFRNEGDGTFRDVSAKSGIAAHPGKGLGVAINDYDRDGRPDIAIANDQVAQQLFHNEGDGTFTETALASGVAYNTDGRAFAGMGIAFADFTNDGWPGLFVNALSLEGYVLFRNSEGLFEDVSHAQGLFRISKPYSGWGAGLLDIDNDGWKDLFVAQGHVMDTISLDNPQISYQQPLLLARNAHGRFEDITSRAGPAFEHPYAARGAAFGDYDNDGDIDIAVNVNDGPALLLRNDSKGNRWITLDLVGTASNRDAIGAAVRIESESGAAQYAYLSTASSYLSANDGRAHFGLGQAGEIKTIEIRWPSGRLQTLRNVEANQILKVTEPPAKE